MGNLLKDKGKKQIDESAKSKDSRRKRRESITLEEREYYDITKTSKILRRDKEKRQKKVADEATGVSTSSALVKGPNSDPVWDVIPPIPEDEIMSTPTTIGG